MKISVEGMVINSHLLNYSMAEQQNRGFADETLADGFAITVNIAVFHFRKTGKHFSYSLFRLTMVRCTLKMFDAFIEIILR